jgi:2-keto-4-pentenoate hydratase
VTVDPSAEAARILAAHREGRTLAPISARAELSMDEAYAIQHRITADREARGQHRIGWKLGYTSLVMREQMGVDQPNFGPLTDAMLVEDGADVAGRFTQPRVEPEVALRFARDVPAGADRAVVLDAVESAHAALEIVDSVWADYRFTIEDNTADGSSAAGIVIGPEIPLDRIDDVAVTLELDGEEFGTGHGRDASGHPADGVVWLVAQLAERAERIRAGDVVITGGLTGAAPLAEGSEISGIFDGGTRVSVRRSRS